MLTETPLPPAPPAESLVNACTATDCRYNKALACGAGAITITVVGGKAVCATFTPVTPVPAS